MESLNLTKYERALETAQLTRDIGKVTHVTGFLICGFIPEVAVGSVCEIFPNSGDPSFLAEVVGFRDREVMLMPLGEMRGLGLGSTILVRRHTGSIGVGEGLLGRVINGLGEPIDGHGDIFLNEEMPIYATGGNPLDRPPIREPMSLGVRAIDALITLGKGQRVGIMAGSGVGKSVLMGMMARNSQADVNVIAMVGERGREVREFIEHTLGPEGLKKSVVIVATSDQSALLRTRAAFVATSVAEYFCQTGKDVLLIMDSVTRFAMAQREIGLNVGEPPATKGYTPSTFALLPKLLERAGSFEGKGSITGLYTVLVEGDDMNDPIGDSVRSIVDGHIVLTRQLAHKGHFPSIDVLQSSSRVMRNVVPPEHFKQSLRVRELMATYREAEDLINIGAYKMGSNSKIDQAIKAEGVIEQMVRQAVEEPSNMEDAQAQLMRLD
ncbi:MAG: FliI/YscN family ATPase [Bdellovibrionales bacterium]|nr:FliI/YscN family ATPase [Bdellovibrionales bacterium]